MKFLREMLERSQGIKVKDSEWVPKQAVRVGEKVLGELPGDLKRFFLAMKAFNKEMADQCEKLHPWAEALAKRCEDNQNNLEPADRLKLQQHTLDHEKMDLFQRHFWNAVKDAFWQHIIEDDNLALRDGWAVVTYSDRVGAVHSLQDLVDALMKN